MVNTKTQRDAERKGTKKSAGFFRKGGFTLVELVIAMGLFAIGMLGLSLMSAGLMSNNLSARQRVVATQLAQNKMEMLESGDYSMIVDSMEENIDAGGVPGNGIFNREVAVAVKTAPVSKEVTVKVSWRLKGEHKAVLKTIVAP